MDRDPGYAPAHAGLADAYSLLLWDDREQGSEAWEPAVREAREAVRLDDESAEARASLALTLASGRWDWRSALAEYDRALQLDSLYAQAWFNSAEPLMILGRLDSAVARTARAIDLDREAAAWVLHGFALFSSGDSAGAHESFREAADVEPAWAGAWLPLLVTYGRLDYPDSVRMASRRLLGVLAPGRDIPEEVHDAAVLVYTGEAPVEQAALFVRTLETYGLKNVAATQAFAASGHLDSAFARLDAAITRHNEWLPVLFPYFEHATTLSSDPSWPSLRQRMGVPSM